MPTLHPDAKTRNFLLSPDDIDRAVLAGVLSPADAQRLVRWAEAQPTSRPLAAEAVAVTHGPERSKGLNLVMVAYYFGAMLMISAFGWLLGNIWQVLGSEGVLVTALIYAAVMASLGGWLYHRGFVVAGGLLVAVAVCLVPLITYSVEDLLGFWPAEAPGNYQGFYPLIHGSWIIMELATVVAAVVALRFVRFGFLTAPLAFSCWFLSMDLAALMFRGSYNEWTQRTGVTIVVGVATMLVGYGLEHLRRREIARNEDYAFWCYLFGTLAFSSGLIALYQNDQISGVLYALTNLGLIGLAVKLQRATVLVFGAIGVHIFLGRLAYVVFKDSFLFPFALAGIGLSLILLTVLAQRWLSRSARKTAVVA